MGGKSSQHQGLTVQVEQSLTHLQHHQQHGLSTQHWKLSTLVRCTNTFIKLNELQKYKTQIHVESVSMCGGDYPLMQQVVQRAHVDPFKHQTDSHQVTGHAHCHQLQQVWMEQLATNTVTQQLLGYAVYP